MAEVKWAGWLNYKAADAHVQGRMLRGQLVSVSYFSVNGGAIRNIILESLEEMRLVSELEQARSLKNLTLYLDVTDNADSLFDLLEIAARGLSVSINFVLMSADTKSHRKGSGWSARIPR